MKAGDLVMTPEGVAQVTQPGVYECETTMGNFVTQDIHLLTVAEAFEIAKHPVSEVAKIYSSSHTWSAVLQLTTNVYDKLEFSPSTGWVHQNTYERNPRGLSINLRRTPAFDAWCALPEIVREKVEEALHP